MTQLDSMPAATKAAPIARLKLPASSRQRMPPAMFRTLPDDALKLAVDELSK